LRHPRSWRRSPILSLVGTGLTMAGISCGAEAPVVEDTVEAVPVFQLTASMEEIMRYMIDPSADAVWDAVVTVVTAEGVVTTEPQTSDDWLMLRRHAVTLIEATDLLLLQGRRVAAEGSRSELPGVDLEPEQIEALLAEDLDSWVGFVAMLHESGLGVLEAIDNADVDALLVAGDLLDVACEVCHVRYWYPPLASQDSAR
jgi:hypothetical protein